MIDRRLLREDPDRLRAALKARGAHVPLESILAMDAEYLSILQEADRLRHERNVKSDEIARKKRNGEDAGSLLAEMKEVAKKIKVYEARQRELDEELEKLMLTIPNLPHSSVPAGADAAGNKVVSSWGEIEEPYFDVKPHWEIGEQLGLIDFGAGRSVAGRGFIVFRGDGALLCRALINLMLDIHREQGYQEVIVPYLASRDAMVGTGQLPKMADDMYHCPQDDLFLIPTAEVPLANLHRRSQIAADELPLNYTAFSPCFRREAGSYGADTRGLLRVHQFDKVELVKIVHPQTSYQELESLVKDACAVLEALELPYRVVELCAGELGFAAAKCYDLEAYAPGVGRWLEVSSCSNCEDFQARREGMRLKRSSGAKHRFPHTLNGSGLALPRTIAALFEFHQTPTGRVRIPAKLVPYMSGKEYLG